MAIIRGEWATGRVWIDDRELLPERSLQVRNHSPTGFSWGYGGSGPAQLALALLLELTRGKQALSLVWYQEVKWQIIAKLPQTDFTLDSREIISFITSAVKAELVQGPATPSHGRPRPPGVVSRSNTREVDLRYSRDQLHAIFHLAYAETERETSGS